MGFRLSLFVDQGVHGRSEIMQNEQQMDGALKHMLQEWETALSTLNRRIQEKVGNDLAADKFPQTARMTGVFAGWQKSFEEEWENLTQQHAWQAKMSQQDVTKLQADVKKLKEKLKVRANRIEAEQKVSGIVVLNFHTTTSFDFLLLLLPPAHA